MGLWWWERWLRVGCRGWIIGVVGNLVVRSGWRGGEEKEEVDVVGGSGAEEGKEGKKVDCVEEG